MGCPTPSARVRPERGGTLSVIVLSDDHLRRILRGCFDCYHDWRSHLALDMDCPQHRQMQPHVVEEILKVPEVGGRYHHYERRAV